MSMSIKCLSALKYLYFVILSLPTKSTSEGEMQIKKKIEIQFNYHGGLDIEQYIPNDDFITITVVH